jgi:phosphoribosylaminoimidazolecarboxamide formyltransferase/IMP cyclohydrolase
LDLRHDALVAWKAAALAKSNAIALAKDGATVAIASGFTSRVDAVEWAIRHAGEKSKGSVLASDGFFPFPDSIELAARANISLILQPGGSKRDEEVKSACIKHKMPMLITKARTFRH